MTTMQIDSVPSAPGRSPAAPNTVPLRTALAHTWYLTGRKLHALVRQPWVLAFSVVQPVIWLFLFGQLFRRVIDIPGFAYHGSYLEVLHGSRTEDPIGFSWKGTGSSGQESEEVFS